MIRFNEQILNDENKYCIQMETDNRRSFELVRDLLRALIDHKVCSVTIADTNDVVTSGYICADVNNNE